MHVFTNDFSKFTFNDFAKIALENTLKAVETGWFNAIAHLDMYRWVFENPKRFPLVTEEYQLSCCEPLIKELLRKIKQKNMFLEINPHFAESKGKLLYTYPEEHIIEWAIQEGVRFSYGSDAHAFQSVGALIVDLENHPIYGQALTIWENDNEDD
jgi:histidinol phosphatase-like PHP family hydrolase